MHLAAVNLKMSLSETLVASTINSAHSIGRSKTHGSIEKGKVADLLILDAPKYVLLFSFFLSFRSLQKTTTIIFIHYFFQFCRWEHLIYQLAGHDEIIEYVIKAGQVVVERTKSVVV